MDQLTSRASKLRTSAHRFQSEVARMQLTIWRDRISRLDVVDTGRLRQSLTSDVSYDRDTIGSEMLFTFIGYGLYQDRGTGRGYRRDNGGDLPFLGRSYRYLHRLDQPRKVGPAWGGGMTSGAPRKRRVWFSKSWWVTQQVVRERMVKLFGEMYRGQFSVLESLHA